MGTRNLADRLKATIDASSPAMLKCFSQCLEVMALVADGGEVEMWRSLAGEVKSLAYERSVTNDEQD